MRYAIKVTFYLYELSQRNSLHRIIFLSNRFIRQIYPMLAHQLSLKIELYLRNPVCWSIIDIHYSDIVVRINTCYMSKILRGSTHLMNFLSLIISSIAFLSLSSTLPLAIESFSYSICSFKYSSNSSLVVAI